MISPSVPSASKNRFVATTAFMWAGISLPPLFLLWTLATYSVNYPRWDDWADLYGALRYTSDGNWDWGYLFARLGGVHYAAVPKLLYALLGKISAWNVAAGNFFCFGMGVLIFLGLAYLLKQTPELKRFRWFLLPLASWCSFSLVQWPLFFSPWGIAWLILPALLRIGILLLGSRLRLLWITLLGMLLTLVAGFSIGAGFSLLLAFPACLLLQLENSPWQRASRPERTACTALWVVFTALCAVLVLHGYHQSNPYDDEVNFMSESGDQRSSALGYALKHPVDAGIFFTAALGSSNGLGLDRLVGNTDMIFHLTVAIGMGLAALLLFALFLVYAFQCRFSPSLPTHLAPWLTIAFTELISAGLIMLGRLGGFPVDRALSPHYASVGLQFLLAVVVMAFICYTDFEQRSTPFSWSTRFKAHRGTIVGLFQFFLGAMLVLNLMSNISSFKEIQNNQAERTYLWDRTYFTSFLPFSGAPSELRRAGEKHIRYMADRQVLQIAPREEIIGLLAAAPQILLPESWDWQKAVHISPPSVKRICYVDGRFLLDRNVFSVLVLYRDGYGKTQYELVPAQRVSDGQNEPLPPAGFASYTFSLSAICFPADTIQVTGIYPFDHQSRKLLKAFDLEKPR